MNGEQRRLANASGIIPRPLSFGTMLHHRGLGPSSAGSPPPSGIPASPSASPGIHAPAPVRPSLGPFVSFASSSSPAPYAPDMATSANMPHPLPGSMSMEMGAGLGMPQTQPFKRKRGRPRKYGPDGTLALAPAPISLALAPLSPTQKRGRGRPPGSGRNQQLAALGGWMAGSAGFGFSPHVITIAAGEDVAAKIMSFSQQGPRAICILTANGTISNVTLRQPAVSGGTVTYEGHFEILSLSGSFLLTETGGTRSRTGGLSVSLAGSDGCVVGGGVAGLLVAASPVQIIVGSFVSKGRKSHHRPQGIASVAHPTAIQVALPLANEALGVKPAVSGSPPPNQSTQAATSNSTQQPQAHTIPAPLQSMGWPVLQAASDTRGKTDIDISLRGG